MHCSLQEKKFFLLHPAPIDAVLLVDLFGYLPYEQAESPEVRVLLGGPDQRLFDYAGELTYICWSVLLVA